MYFGDIPFCTIFADIGAADQLSFYGYFRAFVGVLVDDFCGLSPGNQVVPVGFLDLFPLGVGLGFVGCQEHSGHGLAPFEGFEVSFCAQPADQLYFVL